MIPFDKACALKAGDTIYDDGYKVRVVKTKINKAKKTVAITYTDGGADNFERSNERLSLAPPGQDAQEGCEGAAQSASTEAEGGDEKDATDGSEKIDEEFKSPKIPALSKTKTGRAATELAFARHSAWCSLAPIEGARRDIASKVSKKLGIPLPEFDEPAFHYLTTALAIGEWLSDSGYQQREAFDYGGPPELSLARHKIAAGMLVRFFFHPFVQDIGSIPRADDFIEAFAKASGASYYFGTYAVSASQYIRKATIEMARHLGSDQEGPAPITDEFFEGHRELLAEVDKDSFLPQEAAIDASIQLFASIAYVKENWPGAPDLGDVPEDDAQAHVWLGKYLALSGAFRVPAMMRRHKLARKGATLSDAIESMQSKAPIVLIESVFEGPKGAQIVLPMISNRAGMDYLLLKVPEGIEAWKGVKPKLTIAAYAQ